MNSSLPANPNNNSPASPVSANLLMEQFSAMKAGFRGMNVVRAEFGDGTLFRDDPKHGKTILIGKGAAVVETSATTQIILANLGVSPTEAMRALDAPPPFTQEHMGAFAGHSQSWVSDKLSDS